MLKRIQMRKQINENREEKKRQTRTKFSSSENYIFTEHAKKNEKKEKVWKYFFLKTHTRYECGNDWKRHSFFLGCFYVFSNIYIFKLLVFFS